MADYALYPGAWSGEQVDEAVGRALSGGELDQEIAAIRAAVGSPLVANTAAAMTDTTKVYVYTGTEAGYTAGHWYYWNGSAWADGGVYNAVAVDDELSDSSVNAVQNKVITAALADLEGDVNAASAAALAAYPTESATGAVASTAVGADGIPVKSLVAQIVPVQAGSGDPSPVNVRPISGWTGANIHVAKSSLQLAATYQDVTTYYYLQTTRSSIRKDYYGDTPNGRVLTEPQTRELISPYNDRYTPVPADNYKVTGTVSGSKSTGAVAVEFSNWDGSQSVIATMGGAAVSVPAGFYIYRVEMATESWANGDWMQIDDFAIVVEPSAVYPITFPAAAGTVFGGNLNVTTGLLTITHARIDLGSMTWTDTALPLSVATGTQSIIVAPSSTSVAADILCDSYATAARDALSDKQICIAANGSTIISDTRFNGKTAAQIKTLLNGVYMVYPLKTQQTVQLTPTEVKSLLGANNIFADCGDVAVTFRCDTTLYINSKIAALTALMSEI